MARAAISWSSKKQPSIALSSTEGEYMAISHATKEAIWIQELLQDIQFPVPNPTTILINNQGAIALTSNPTFHARMRHIGVCHHFICDQVEKQDIILNYIPTDDQVANILMKALSFDKFSKFGSLMGLQG